MHDPHASHPCRLSLRSFVYTCVFFVSGIAVSIAAQTPDVLGVARVGATYTPPSPTQLTAGLALIGTAAASTAAAGYAAHRTKSALPGQVYEFTAGVLFALALGLSEMTRPTVVRPPPSLPPAPLHPSLAIAITPRAVSHSAVSSRTAKPDRARLSSCPTSFL